VICAENLSSENILFIKREMHASSFAPIVIKTTLIALYAVFPFPERIRRLKTFFAGIAKKMRITVKSAAN
jgi:hypothetical protein